MKKRSIVAIVVATAVIITGMVFLVHPKASTSGKPKSAYEFTQVSRGNIESVVSSSGTLAAVSTVSILSEMSGRVERVYADYNDTVKKGQILVALNTDMLKLSATEDEAAVRKAQANYDLQRVDYENKKKLFEKGLVSEYEFKSSKASLDVYAAELVSAQSALSIDTMKINQYALITSPIDGIVLDKNVDVGQSVVEGSSSNAASLFTLAESLAKMQIKAEVDELDISSIHKGQEVRFTVEAQPGLSFTGTVDQIRLVPETSDNVVTYYVIVNAGNKDGKLLPGMTTELEFIKARKTNVLMVPSAALRFTPPGLSDAEIEDLKFQAELAELPADQREAALKQNEEERALAGSSSSTETQGQSRGLTGIVMPMGGGPGGFRRARGGAEGSNGSGAANGAAESAKKPLWYIDDAGKLAVRMVGIGSTDGLNTEILGADDLEGKDVILKVKVE